MTPRGNLLEGITRLSVFELAKEASIEALEADLLPDDLRSADEAFTSTTAGGLTPITQVDGRPLGNGAPGLLTTQLTKRYWQKREAGWHGTSVAEVLAKIPPLVKH
jgi:branched-chain amino acid aminotransferase